MKEGREKYLHPEVEGEEKSENSDSLVIVRATHRSTDVGGDHANKGSSQESSRSSSRSLEKNDKLVGGYTSRTKRKVAMQVAQAKMGARKTQTLRT